MRKIYKNKKSGFTLYETLITLAIIGIVSIICVGTVVSDIRRDETVIRLKKSYSVLQQAFDLAYVKYGNLSDSDVINDSEDTRSLKFFDKYLKEQLKLAKDCNIMDFGDCEFSFKQLNSQEKSLDSSWVRFFLSDGTFMALKLSTDNNDSAVSFYVATRGKRRLNVVARDVFLFDYWLKNQSHPEYEGKILPQGYQYPRDELILPLNENSCYKTATGNYCGAVIMKDSWEMKYGYPWAQARYAVK